jgi:hypothetical protein
MIWIFAGQCDAITQLMAGEPSDFLVEHVAPLCSAARAGNGLFDDERTLQAKSIS